MFSAWVFLIFFSDNWCSVHGSFLFCFQIIGVQYMGLSCNFRQLVFSIWAFLVLSDNWYSVHLVFLALSDNWFSVHGSYFVLFSDNWCSVHESFL